MRKEFGYSRSTCACRKCQIWCEHQPGYLVPSDLARLIPEYDDPIAWAEVHLRASLGFKAIVGLMTFCIPSLVPAKQANGHCHWYSNGTCDVHEIAPFGCAFLDQHMTNTAAEQRNTAGRDARAEAFQNDEVNSQIWEHLWNKGLRYVTTDVDRHAALQQIAKIDRVIQRKRVWQQEKKEGGKQSNSGSSAESKETANQRRCSTAECGMANVVSSHVLLVRA